MEDVISWNVNQYILMGIMLGTFGFIGFRRGVNRELLSVVGVAVAILISGGLASKVGPQVNLFYKLVRFVLGGGFSGGDPVAAWQKTSSLPDLIQTQEDLQVFSLLIFFLVVMLFYLWGQRRIADPNSLMLRILGALTGVINGFLIAYYLVPIVLPAPKAVITLPSGEVRQTLTSGQMIARMVAFFVFVLIALGLYTASGRKKQG